MASTSIRPLSDHLINQIAAGEVIERPASVVKELVENSLDADAGRVDVEVSGGGVQSIVVRDDGAGIEGGEIHAALARHCTSKIGGDNDLAAIATLGFRGEALASVGAVADIEIATRAAIDRHGWQVVAAAGQPPGQPIAHRHGVGTSVTVRDLFHNTPARRRFLKSARTEFIHIQRLIRNLAFARPEIQLSLLQEGTRGLKLGSALLGQTAPRWQSLFGASFCAGAETVDVDDGTVRVRGWVGGPLLAGNRADIQFLAVNGRSVRDRQIAHAIRLAYEDRIATGKHPAYALALELPIEALDVNVHPAKHEVRFADVRTVHDLVYSAVRRALDGETVVYASTKSAPATMSLAETAAKFNPAPSRAGASLATTAAAVAKLPNPVALVDDRILLMIDDKHVLALDLRAAWSEILQQRFRQGACGQRPLLLPRQVADSDGVLDPTVREALHGSGCEFDAIGPGTDVLRTVPLIFPHVDDEHFVIRLLQLLHESGPDHAVTVSLARAAGESVVLGASGLASTKALDEFARSCAQIGVAPLDFAFRVSAADLLEIAAR